MEKNLFIHTGWDEVDTWQIQFINCTMLRDFGPIKKDQKFDWIVIDTENAVIKFGMEPDYNPIEVGFCLVPDRA